MYREAPPEMPPAQYAEAPPEYAPPEYIPPQPVTQATYEPPPAPAPPGPVTSEEPPVYEEARPPEAPGYTPPPPPEQPEAATRETEGSLPAGFEDAGVEQVRPGHVTEDEYRLPPEYKEIMGEPGKGRQDTAPWEVDVAPEAPVAGPREVAVPEPEATGHEWPFEESPSAVPEAEGPPGPPSPDTQDAGYGPSPETREPQVGPPPAPGALPGTGTSPAQERPENLRSFFFEEEVEEKKKGKEKPEDFWE